MVREVLTLETRELKLGVTGSRLSSVRSRSERETAVRVYDDGRVGTASGVGDVSLDALTDQARDALRPRPRRRAHPQRLPQRRGDGPGRPARSDRVPAEPAA